MTNDELYAYYEQHAELAIEYMDKVSALFRPLNDEALDEVIRYLEGDKEIYRGKLRSETLRSARAEKGKRIQLARFRELHAADPTIPGMCSHGEDMRKCDKHNY